MTNLLIAYNSIPYEAKSLTPSFTESDLFSADNLLTNKKSDWITVNAGGTWSIKFDLGKDSTGADIEKAAEYIILGNALGVLSSSLTFYLKYSDDDSTYTTATSFTNTDAAAALKGIKKADYIKTFTATAGHRYWKIECSGNCIGLGKVYFGEFLDLEVDPNEIKDEFKQKKIYYSDGGYTTYGINKPLQREYKLEWRGITKAKLEEFESIIHRLKDKPLFFLYLETVTDILSGENLISVNLDDYDYEYLSDDYIVLNCNFIESV